MTDNIINRKKHNWKWKIKANKESETVDKYCKCPKCKRDFMEYFAGLDYDICELPNFCPNCGEDMRDD